MFNTNGGAIDDPRDNMSWLFDAQRGQADRTLELQDQYWQKYLGAGYNPMVDYGMPRGLSTMAMRNYIYDLNPTPVAQAVQTPALPVSDLGGNTPQKPRDMKRPGWQVWQNGGWQPEQTPQVPAYQGPNPMLNLTGQGSPEAQFKTQFSGRSWDGNNWMQTKGAYNPGYNPNLPLSWPQTPPSQSEQDANFKRLIRLLQLR